MNKKTRIGIGVALASVFAAAVVGVGFWIQRERHRLPTLATPPGAVVPAGLRYVGGSEFDSKNPAAEECLWKLGGERAIDGRNGFAIADGVLTLTLRNDSDGGFPRKRAPHHIPRSPKFSFGVFLEAPWVLDFRRPGRVEIRAKVRHENRNQVHLDILEEGWAISARFFSMIEPEPTLGCSWPDFFEKENDGEFRTYVFRWAYGEAAFFIDDETQGLFKRSANSPAPYADFFWPQGLREHIPASWTTNPDVRNFVNRRVWALDKKTSPLILEISPGRGADFDARCPNDELAVDYIRIYQE